MAAHQATLTEHTLRGTPRVAEFTLTVLMKEFAAFKGDLSAIIEPSVVEKHQFHNLQIYKEDLDHPNHLSGAQKLYLQLRFNNFRRAVLKYNLMNNRADKSTSESSRIFQQASTRVFDDAGGGGGGTSSPSGAD